MKSLVIFAIVATVSAADGTGWQPPPPPPRPTLNTTCELVDQMFPFVENYVLTEIKEIVFELENIKKTLPNGTIKESVNDTMVRTTLLYKDTFDEAIYWRINRQKLCIFQNEGCVDSHEVCFRACTNAFITKMSRHPQFSHLSQEKITTIEGGTKMREFIKSYLNGSAFVPAGVDNEEIWTKFCAAAIKAETCVDGCPELSKHEAVMKFPGLFKLGCDADFKSSIGCLVEVGKVDNQACQTKCFFHAIKLKEFIASRDAAPSERDSATKDVLESGCKFVNCRLHCRKADIVNKCQEKGFEQAKKLTSVMASSVKMLYQLGDGDLNNWPEVCKSDKIIEQ